MAHCGRVSAYQDWEADMVTDESAYLELKGLIIDWAHASAPSHARFFGAQLEPEEVVVMLRRIIKDFEGAKA